MSHIGCHSCISTGRTPVLSSVWRHSLRGTDNAWTTPVSLEQTTQQVAFDVEYMVSVEVEDTLLVEIEHTTCLCWGFYYCDKTPGPKATKRIDFSLQLSGHTPSLREVRTGPQGRNLEAGAGTEAMKEAAYWLAPRGLFRLLSYISQDPPV